MKRHWLKKMKRETDPYFDPDNITMYKSGIRKTVWFLVIAVVVIILFLFVL